MFQTNIIEYQNKAKTWTKQKIPLFVRLLARYKATAWHGEPPLPWYVLVFHKEPFFLNMMTLVLCTTCPRRIDHTRKGCAPTKSNQQMSMFMPRIHTSDTIFPHQRQDGMVGWWFCLRCLAMVRRQKNLKMKNHIRQPLRLRHCCIILWISIRLSLNTLQTNGMHCTQNQTQQYFCCSQMVCKVRRLSYFEVSEED